MFSKKKQEKPRRSGGLSQYGLFDVPTDLNFEEDGGDDNSDGGDSDLEAELAALASGGGTRPKRPARKAAPPAVDLDAMVSASLRDIPSDEELSGDDDPELLSELNDITGEEKPEPQPVAAPTPPSDIKTLLEERLKMYETAEANAKAAGETSRARRFNRGIKTLKDLHRQANAGRPVNNDDIPPEVTVNIQKREPPTEAPSEETLPVRPAPPPPDSTPSPTDPVPAPPDPVSSPPDPAPADTQELSAENRELLEMLKGRRDQYKLAALNAKKNGEVAMAVSHVKVLKQFELVIKAVENGQPVDLSRMPGPPVEESAAVEKSETQSDEATPEEAVPEPEVQLITAGSVLEALEQRLDVYKKQEEAAKEQENSSKARRMGRIVKQFEGAIKSHKQGKPVPFDELPTPPGYAPIPGTEKPAPEAQAPVKEEPKPKASSEVPKPQASSEDPKPPPRQTSRSSGNRMPTTHLDKQLSLLLARQKEFKEAALSAKKKGEMAEAKEFLRTAKGFDPLIEATKGGLPVDISSLPVPPSVKAQLDVEYELVMADECTEDDAGVMDVVTRLEQQLTKQLKMCLTTRDHHKALGDVAGTNRFEQLALSVTKDLDVVRIAKRTNGAAVPRFHYEVRDFSIVKSFTELNDNDLELTVVRGVNYNCSNPKDIDTYVKFEFPYPQEEPFRERTATVKDTNNPEYNATYMIPIQRKARPCQRVFKRQAVKLEVYSKGGFFRGDTLLGTVTVKLQPLETQCELHDSFELLEGRKKVGGKLEVRIRIRDPLLSKEVEKLSERWLIIDH